MGEIILFSHITQYFMIMMKILLCIVRKFVLNLTFHVSQTVHSNYYVNLTQDEYVRK